MTRVSILLLALTGGLAVLAAGCGTVSSVRALRKGQSALGVGLGGPVAHVAGMDIPLPYTVARYRYGVNDKSSIYAGGHLMVAALGVAGLEAGWAWHPLTQKKYRPAVSASAGLAALVKSGDGHALFPQLDVTGSYLLGDRSLTYFGIQSMYQLADKPYAVFAPFVGEEVRLGSRVSLCAEAKWYAPTEKASPRSVDYRIPIAGQGAVGFVLGVNYQFGGWYE
ncbi:MAG: hypothetical protein ABIL25_06125 [candidate division WOR-3 bacterium]